MRSDTVETVLPEMKLGLAPLVDARDAGIWPPPEDRRWWAHSRTFYVERAKRAIAALEAGDNSRDHLALLGFAALAALHVRAQGH